MWELLQLRKPQEITPTLTKTFRFLNYFSSPLHPFAKKDRRHKITNEVHQGCHFKPWTPHLPHRLFSKPPFLEVCHLQLSTQRLLDIQHGFPPTPAQSTFFHNPHKSPPLWILLTFSIGPRNGMQRLRGGLALPPLFSPHPCFSPSHNP